MTFVCSQSVHACTSDSPVFVNTELSLCFNAFDTQYIYIINIYSYVTAVLYGTCQILYIYVTVKYANNGEFDGRMHI